MDLSDQIADEATIRRLTLNPEMVTCPVCKGCTLVVMYLKETLFSSEERRAVCTRCKGEGRIEKGG